MRKIASLLSLVAAVAIGTSVRADVIGASQSLSGLLYNTGTQVDPSVTVGDKVFHHFTYTFSGDMPSEGSVNVIPFQDVDGNFGLRFQGGFSDRPGSGASTASVGYTVDVAAGADFTISDAHLGGDPATSGVGNVTVTETWTPVTGGGISGSPQAVISSISPGSTVDPNTGLSIPDKIFNASVSFLPDSYTGLVVSKVIVADAGDLFIGNVNNTSVADITAIDQTFSQTPGLPNNGGTPEPMTLSLFGLGSAALLFRRGRKS